MIKKTHILVSLGLALLTSTSTTALAAQSTGFVLAPVAKPEATPQAYFQQEGQVRRLIADKRDLFFAGETANREYPFIVLPSEMTGAAKLVLTLQTAISVAPERSAMRVFINDRDIGAVALRSGDPQQIELELPKGLLQPGYNAVTILLDQTHRVDCSVEATYELWTQIDPARSGFVFTRNTKDDPQDLSTLLAFSRDANGHAAINGLLPAGAGNEDVSRVLSVVQALAIMGHFDRPSVTIGQDAASGAGVDVVVGTYATIRDLTGTEAPMEAGVHFDVNPANGRSRMILGARTAEELNDAIRNFTTEAQRELPDGTAQGRRALDNRRGRLLASGSRNPLAELGYIARPFAGRHLQQSFAFNLPADFYPGDYGAANLRLNAEYAAGLSPDAQLVVRANGSTVANIRLGEGRSGRIEGQILPIPLNKLRPGYNEIVFEANLSSAADAACNPEVLTGNAARFFIKGDTSLEIPAFAQIGHAPDLAVVSAGSINSGTSAEPSPLPLYIENMGDQSLAAAGTFLAKMAYASREVTPVSVTASWPVEKRGSLLAFGTFDHLPQQLRSDLGIEVNSLSGNVTPVLDTTAPQGELAAEVTPALPISGEEVKAESSGFLGDRIGAALGSFSSGMASQIRAQAAQMRLVDDPNVLTDSAVYQIPTDTDVLVAQRLVNDRDAWTVVAAKDQATLSESMTALTRPDVWGSLGGAVQSFDKEGKTLERKDASHQVLHETKPLDLKNGRLIVAGWFSNNPREFTVMQIIAAILLGASTYVVLRRGRSTR